MFGLCILIFVVFDFDWVECIGFGVGGGYGRFLEMLVVGRCGVNIGMVWL